MERCPNCNSTAGYYVKERVSGNIYFNYNFDGTVSDNCEMYDHLSHKAGKVAYCRNCEKRLFNIDKKGQILDKNDGA